MYSIPCLDVLPLVEDMSRNICFGVGLFLTSLLVYLHESACTWKCTATDPLNIIRQCHLRGLSSFVRGIPFWVYRFRLPATSYHVCNLVSSSVLFSFIYSTSTAENNKWTSFLPHVRVHGVHFFHRHTCYSFETIPRSDVLLILRKGLWMDQWRWGRTLDVTDEFQ